MFQIPYPFSITYVVLKNPFKSGTLWLFMVCSC